MRQLLLATLALCAACFAAEPAGHAFFAMDNGLNDVKTCAEKAQLLKELGYPGIGWRPGRTAEMLKELDANGLKMFSFYISANIDGANTKCDPKLAAELDLLKGRETIVWLLLTKSKTGDHTSAAGKAADYEGAVRATRELGQLAADRNLRLALYPHVGCYAETVLEELKIVKDVNLPNVGLSLTLCHFLKLDSEQNLERVLGEIAPHLFLVQICGADSGDTQKMDWTKLIQPLGKGTFDMGKFVRMLDAAGYKGPLALQCFQVKQPAREHLAASMAAWKALK